MELNEFLVGMNRLKSALIAKVDNIKNAVLSINYDTQINHMKDIADGIGKETTALELKAKVNTLLTPMDMVYKDCIPLEEGMELFTVDHIDPNKKYRIVELRYPNVTIEGNSIENSVLDYEFPKALYHLGFTDGGPVLSASGRVYYLEMK